MQVGLKMPIKARLTQVLPTYSVLPASTQRIQWPTVDTSKLYANILVDWEQYTKNTVGSPGNTKGS